MLSRRDLLILSGAAAVSAAPSSLTGKERVDRALAGEDVDRPPFTFWYHFLDEKLPGERHAASTLKFHRKFRTDLVKVMSDYPFPRPSGEWFEVKVDENPYPRQIRALELIRAGLRGRNYFVETVFNPWNVAEKLSSPALVGQMMREKPQVLLDALEAIARSEAGHVRKALKAGAAGVFLAIANAQDGILTREEYQKFSAPFDRMIVEAAGGAPLNILHLHGDKVYLDLFWKGWPVAAINYSNFGTGVSVAQARANYDGLLLTGIDEVNFRKLGEEELKRQIQTAREAAGKRFLLTPGCSVPNETTDAEMMRLVRAVGA
jgi:uroporphyrinogen decarboxylase